MFAFYTQRPSRMYYTFYYTYVYNTLIEPWNHGTKAPFREEATNVRVSLSSLMSHIQKHVLVMFFSE